MASMDTTIESQPWGTTRDGQPVELYTLANGQLRLSVIPFGARLVALETPDRHGNFADILLGYSNLAAYEADRFFLGAAVGRYCNRIADGRFTLDGHQYQVPPNNGPNALHGGPDNFSKRLWTASLVPGGLELSLYSPDGDQGFPGALTARVRYTLEASTLRVDFFAETSASTPTALTAHTYFNLTGDPRNTVYDHLLHVPAEAYTPVNDVLIPTGELAPVAGTPFDFRAAKPIGQDIHIHNHQLALGHGYDHNFVLKTANSDDLVLAAAVTEPTTGRTLNVRTTEPGLQFYTGNFLDPATLGKRGIPLAPRTGFCLETQHFPDSPNHPTFPSATLHPDQPLHSATLFTFGAN
jgi:aldose 1-epimerase